MLLTAEKKYTDFQKGQVILVNKPLDWTSFDIVNKIRSTLKPITGKIKVGHAGTLDPKADGLLIICTGKSTKTIDAYQNLDKIYEGEIFLGASTPSYDSETEADFKFEMAHIELDEIKEACASFSGFIKQVPPVFSAIKVKGEASYLAARKGLKPKLKERTVEIKEFSVLSYQYPLVKFRVHCSKGTYIRSLAHDLGQHLKGGAYLKYLKRTAIGEYKLSDAWEIDDLTAYIKEYALKNV
ncbi:MAG: tRNA pseudouridine(55) synthase TruB [Chitinophagales bacterium]|nr:tRNA pseudouridine(55) synthase TruB [Chitinophagales bacterium]